jgi:hypothetical protein
MYFYCVYIFQYIKFVLFKVLKQIWNTLFLASFITTRYGFSYGIRTWLMTHVYVNFVVSSCVMWFFEFIRNSQCSSSLIILESKNLHFHLFKSLKELLVFWLVPWLFFFLRTKIESSRILRATKQVGIYPG